MNIQFDGLVTLYRQILCKVQAMDILVCRTMIQLTLSMYLTDLLFFCCRTTFAESAVILVDRISETVTVNTGINDTRICY